MKLFRLVFATTAIAASAHAQEEPRWSQSEASTLTFRAVQQGAVFVGSFERFDTKIFLDPENLAQGSITVSVEMASVNTQYDDRDEVLRSPEFFDVTKWPHASFHSSDIRRLGESEFEATGELTIRDQSQPLILAFYFTETGAEANLTGEVVISRLDYGVGQGEWTDTTWVGRDVVVVFELTLTHPGGAVPAAGSAQKLPGRVALNSQ